MIKPELVEGIRHAISKGESLKQAMMSFYRAGYKKEDVEDSAREYQRLYYFQQMQNPQQTNQSSQQFGQTTQTNKTSNQPQTQQPLSSLPSQSPMQNSIQQAPQYQQMPQQNPQQVSNYNSMQKPKRSFGKIMIILLVLFLIILLVGVGLLFFFKESIINYLANNL